MRIFSILMVFSSGCAAMECIDVAGVEREFIVAAPETYTRGELPVVIALHGGGGTARSMERYTDFDEVARREGFLAVFPNGIGRGWNDGRAISRDAENVDDIAFLNALLDHLEATYDIDESRVFVTGISNGGFMSIRAACEMPDRITAIAPVAASISEALAKTCGPKVSAFFLHGTEDEWVPYEGGAVMSEDAGRGRATGIPSTIDLWVSTNQCNPTPAELATIDERDDDTIVKPKRYEGCANDVDLLLYEIEGGGHTWPGKSSIVDFAIGTSSDEIDGTETIWKWFSER